MNINRDNYEEWLLDLIEGRLSVSEEEQMRDFLDKNPDIKAESEDLEAFVLEPQQSRSFTSKSSLKKSTLEIEGLTRNDYLFIQKTEGALSSAEKKEYGVLLDTDPEAGKEQELYDRTILTPDNSVSYPHKPRLKRVTIIPFVTKDILNKAAAAGIILLMATALWFNLNKENPAALKAAKEQHVETQQANPEPAPGKTTIPPAGNEVMLIAETEKLPAAESTVAPQVTAIKPLQPVPAFKKLHGLDAGNVIRPVKLNGYEIALNQIMPLYLAYLRSQKEDTFAEEKQATPEKEKQNVLLAGSVKMVNLMTGNSFRLRRKVNEQGDVVAYSFATPNLQIDHKVKK